MKQGGKLLFVVTSQDSLGLHATGLWLEEFAVPYLLCREAGWEVTVASPHGGRVPLDPRSVSDDQPAAWQEAVAALQHTMVLAAAAQEDYDGLVLPGGHGPMLDLARNEPLAALLRRADAGGWVIGAICHGVAGLLSARGEEGRPLVAGRRLTSFTDLEERMVEFDAAVPFLLEERLRSVGAVFVHGAPWSSFVVRDGALVTGQNPQSSEAFAQEVLAALAERVRQESPAAQTPEKR